MNKVKGGCRCGAIHYESDSAPIKLIASNCRHNHRHPKATVAVSIGVRDTTLRVSGLVPSVYRDTRPSGSVVLRFFCPECSTPLFTQTESEPSSIFVKASTLVAAAWHQPRVFYNSARYRQRTPPTNQGHRLLELFDWLKRAARLWLPTSSIDRPRSTGSLNPAFTLSFRPSFPTR